MCNADRVTVTAGFEPVCVGIREECLTVSIGTGGSGGDGHGLPTDRDGQSPKRVHCDLAVADAHGACAARSVRIAEAVRLHERVGVDRRPRHARTGDRPR